MSEQGTRAAYGDRAAEYSRLLGSIDQMAAADGRRIEDWAARADGTGAGEDRSGGLLLDLGCGPGHWTAHLAAKGHRMIGVDPVPAFVDHARRSHAGVAYRTGDVFGPGVEDASCAGVLAWYSLIHLDPARMQEAVDAIACLLRPGGTLLLGFFDGPRIEPFDHAITTAYFWPASALQKLLVEDGFTILDVEQRTDTGARPHGAIEARWDAPEEDPA